MTDMDWADEIAKDWDPKEAIATALRKAKADGMREAAEIAEQFSSNGQSDYAAGMDDAIGYAVRYILEAASKLETSTE